MNENELVVIAKNSGLPQTKSQALLEIFQEYFGIAAEWEKAAKFIKVTDESQTDLMLKAREGRKFLQDARINLEKTRVSQKKFALLEGKAIDGMANVLKASIVPVEQYLAEQENFVVNKKKAEVLARQEQAMKDLEAKEAAEEKVLIDRLEKERLESFRRREEAEEEARVAQIEKDKAIEKAEKIEKQRRLEKEKHQREIEQKQRENFEREEKIRLENEKKLAAEQKKLEKVESEFIALEEATQEKDVIIENKETEIGELESLVNVQEEQIEEIRKDVPANIPIPEKELAEAVEHIESLEEVKPSIDEVQCPACGNIFKRTLPSGIQIT